MAKKPTPIEEAVASAPDWNITFDGHTYPLIPSMEAIRTLETGCGRTLFSIVDEGRVNTLTLNDLAVVTVALITGGDIRRFNTLHDKRLGLAMTAHAPIFEYGMTQVFTRVLPPLAAALVGSVDAHGKPVGLQKAA